MTKCWPVKVEAASIPISYTATWPKQLDPSLQSTCQKVMKFFWNLIIFFPIGLIRLGITFVKHIAWSYVVPGCVEINASSAGKIILNTYKGNRVTLTSPDGAKLDGAFFPGTRHPEKAIIFAFGNAMQWETSDRWLKILKPLGVSILSVNPRGVGKSTGMRSEEGYALDIYTFHEYLVDELHMDPENILTVGFSMGAGIGACGLKHVQEKHPDKNISMVSICSFKDLATEIDALLSNINSCVAGLMRLGAKVLSLNLKAKAAWDSLKGEKCLFYCPSDSVVPLKASLFDEVIKTDPTSVTTIVKMHEELIPNFISHNRPFFVDEAQEFYKQLFKILRLTYEDIDLENVNLNENNDQSAIEKPLELLLHSKSFPTTSNNPHLNVQVLYPKVPVAV